MHAPAAQCVCNLRTRANAPNMQWAARSSRFSAQDKVSVHTKGRCLGSTAAALAIDEPCTLQPHPSDLLAAQMQSSHVVSSVETSYDPSAPRPGRSGVTFMNLLHIRQDCTVQSQCCYTHFKVSKSQHHIFFVFLQRLCPDTRAACAVPSWFKCHHRRKRCWKICPGRSVWAGV